MNFKIEILASFEFCEVSIYQQTADKIFTLQIADKIFTFHLHFQLKSKRECLSYEQSVQSEQAKRKFSPEGRG